MSISFLRSGKGQVPRLILGYVLADSGGTSLIVREFVPIFTKEGRNFFAQISSIMYSFVETLVHSELKHVETENIHLYFARLGDFILVLFSDVEDEKLANLAGNIVKVVNDLGYDPFSIQLDDNVREEVIGVIEKNIITLPPSINFLKKIITMIKPILDESNNISLELETSEKKFVTLDEFLKRRRISKIKKVDYADIINNIANGSFSKALDLSLRWVSEVKDDVSLPLFLKTYIFNRLTGVDNAILSLEELSKYVSEINHPILRTYLMNELSSFKQIKAGIERKFYFLKHRRMFLTKILTDTRESIQYAIISFPPPDVETAKVLKEKFGDDYLIFSSYCDDFLYFYNTLLMKETSQDVWLVRMGEIYQRMVSTMDKNKIAGLSYLRSHLINNLASLVQSELKTDEAKNILETLIKNWDTWEKELKKIKGFWLDLKAEIISLYFELFRWYVKLKGEEIDSVLFKKHEKSALEYLKVFLSYEKNDLVPKIQIYRSLSMIMLALTDILTANNKYSSNIIDLISSMLTDELAVIWSENPAEYAIIYRNLLKSLANIARFVKLESVRQNLLSEIGKELLSLAQSFEKLPMLYWFFLLDSLEILAVSDRSGKELAAEVVKHNEREAPLPIKHLMNLVTKSD